MRHSILEAAVEVFLELGYARASMSEISARLGGSKATLYGYFTSKEQLFVEAVHHIVASELHPAFRDLESMTDQDPAVALTTFGERILVALLKPRAIAARRMIIAEAMQSDIGRLFWFSGPQISLTSVAAYLAGATKAGRLTIANVEVATLHLLSLLESEVAWRWQYNIQNAFTRNEIRQAIRRAVNVFVLAYGPGTRKTSRRAHAMGAQIRS